ncbi:testis-specific serine/threonine-protein kinase 6 [Myripristis murdjan]|uniref:testis-specific serine/threonine-protein kinase 6 n=1 Tax=Myripristis murdjan TaxID=586833 RepID=UPI001175DA3A|nr:testis-specific serine/threonine-protein kinase 6-like [Myripristis murdjan]
MGQSNVLKGYTFGPTIGEGAFSKVRLATAQNGSKVAIKIVNYKSAPQDFVKKFLPRELATLKIVRHDNIIRVHELLELRNRWVCIVMERATTDLLRKIKEVRRIPVDKSRDIFAQIVSAVTYLHQNNIAHRDLKCENVLLMKNDQVKIADFGFARTAVGFPELSETFCGSAAYTPPEVLLCTPYDPKKFDVWSTGVILFIMVTGNMPFDDTNIAQLPHIQKRPLAFPDGVELAVSCRTFISFLLNFSPFLRPSIEQVVQHSWLEKDSDNIAQ